jgi:hypothetical protein
MMKPRANPLAAVLLLVVCSPAFGQSRLLFSDDFERGLRRWTTFGEGSAVIHESNDGAHGHVLLLRPQGDAVSLIKQSSNWGPVRIEGDVFFPTNGDNYLGVVYNFKRVRSRMDFGVVYIKGNGSYLAVNPFRDFNVGRTLYEEYHTPLKDKALIRTGQWQHFKVEVVGKSCHFYVGDMDTPQLTFSALELSSGAIGLQPRSVGDDVWVDNITVTSIKRFSYDGPPRPQIKYPRNSLLLDWKVNGPFTRTKDSIARDPARSKGWRPFAPDDRGAVITGRVVDYHGVSTVAYFRTQVQAETPRDAFLHLSTVDDLALWVNGRFQWFIPRSGYAWYDFSENPQHKGQRIPISLNQGANEIVLRVRGGVYASGGFYARVEQ